MRPIRHLAAVCAALCACLLLGCAPHPALRQPEPGPEPAVQAAPAVREAAQMPAVQPEPEPVPDVLPEPEPEPEPTAHIQTGEPVTADGAELPGGSMVIDGVRYIRLQELADALGLEAETGDSVWTATWRGQALQLRAGSSFLTLDGTPSALEAPPVGTEDGLLVPYCSLCAAMGISVFYDAEYGRWYLTPGAGRWTAAPGYRVPVLMYHAVSDDIWGYEELFVSPSAMEEELKYLVENGYEPIWFEDLAHIEDYEKPVILTFDDGYLDNYTELFPLLKEYGVKATFFIISGKLGGTFMTPEMVTEVSQSGLVSVQSHTHTHPNLAWLTPQQQEREMVDSKLAITRLTGREPFVFCYPEGKCTMQTLALTRRYYHFGVHMSGWTYDTGTDPIYVYRFYIPRGLDLYSFAAQLVY